MNSNLQRTQPALQVQQLLDSKSKEIYRDIMKELDTKDIELDKLRGLINLYPDATKSSVKKIISNYNVPEKLLSCEIKDKNYNAILTEKEFCNLIRGYDLKNVLFEKNIDGKKDNIEYLFTLYELMGGDNNGITKEKLSICLGKVLSLYNNPNEYLNDNFDPDTINKRYTTDVQEILDLLGDGEKLTLKEFVNAMSSDCVTDFENININFLDKPSN